MSSRGIRMLWNARYPLAWMLPIGIIVLWLPVPIFLSAIEQGDDASRIIGTALTTVAAVLALSIAVIVLAAQVYTSSRQARYGGALTDFSRRTGILRVLNLGVTVLIVGGVALLGGGHGAPGGWAGIWFIAIAGAFLLLVPVVFWLILRSIDPAKLEQHGRQVMDELIEQEAFGAATNAVLHNAYEELCSEIDFEIQPFRFRDPPSDVVLMSAPQSGVIFDVHDKRLRQVAATATAAGLSVTAHAAIRYPVNRGDPLLVADQPFDTPMSDAKVFRIRPADVHEYSELSETIHEEALEAIRSGRPTWYASVAQTYELLILGPAQRLADMGFDPNIAGGAQAFLSIRSPIEHIASNLFEELRAAVESDSQEVATDVFYLPKHLAQKASVLGANRILENTLRLYPSIYYLLVSQPRKRSFDILRDRAWRHLIEFENYPISRDLERASDQESLRPVIHALEVADGQIVDLLKWAIEMGDHETLDPCLRHWAENLRHWEPGQARPHEWEVERMRATDGFDPSELREAEKTLEFLQYAAQEKSRLDRTRQTYLYGLAMWSLRLARRGDGDNDHVRTFEKLADRLGGADEIISSASDSLSGPNYGLFSNWVTFEQPEMVVHVGGADADLLATMIVALARSTAEGSSLSVPPLEWVPGRLAQIEATIDQLSKEGHLWEALQIADHNKALANVSKALKESATAQSEIEDERIRSIAVSFEVRELLLNQVQAGWAESEMVVSLFRAFSAIRKDDATNLTARYATAWVEKSFLDSQSDLGDIGMALGRRLSFGEVAALLEVFEDCPSVSAEAGEEMQSIQSQTTAMRSEAFNPSVLLLPSDWSLHRSLGLGLNIGRSAASRHDPLPARSVGRYLGRVDGVHALSTGSIEGKAILADLSALAEWCVPSDEPEASLDLTVKEFDHAAALELAAKSVFDADVEHKALDIMKNGLLTASETFQIRVLDSTAGRIIRFGVSGPRLEEE